MYKSKGVIRMSEKVEDRKEFVEPELVKFEEPLDVVTTMPSGSPINTTG